MTAATSDTSAQMLLPALPVDLTGTGLNVEEVRARAAQGEPPASGGQLKWDGGMGMGMGLVDPLIGSIRTGAVFYGWLHGGRLIDSNAFPSETSFDWAGQSCFVGAHHTPPTSHLNRDSGGVPDAGALGVGGAARNRGGGGAGPHGVGGEADGVHARTGKWEGGDAW